MGTQGGTLRQQRKNPDNCGGYGAHVHAAKRGAGADGAQRLVPLVGCGHRHQVQPGALDAHADHPGHAVGDMAVAARIAQPLADAFKLAVVGIVLVAAQLLIDRARLRLAPEAAPGRGEAVQQRSLPHPGHCRNTDDSDRSSITVQRHDARTMPLNILLTNDDGIFIQHVLHSSGRI